MSIRKAVKNPPRPPKSLLEFVWMMIKQMPMNLLRQIPWMILVSGFTWVFHTYVLVVINQGFDVSVASQWIKGILNAKSSPSGILFWTLMGGVASLGFGQLKQYGLSKYVTSIGTTPGWIAGSLKGFSLARLPLLFGSLAAGLFGLALVNNPLYAIQLGLLLGGEWVAQGRGILGIVVPLGWSDLQRLFRRGAAPAPFSRSWMVFILGGLSLSAFLGLFFPVWFLACNLGVALVLTVILLFVKTGRPSPRGAALLLAGLLGLGWLALRVNGVAFADDGGWNEAGGTLSSWIVSEGAVLAIGFGFIPSFGAGLGWWFGSGLAGIFGIIPDGEVETGTETDTTPEWVTDPEIKNAVNAWEKEAQDAINEAEKYRKQWEDTRGTLDINDPNYKNLKDQYDQYINYQNKRAEDAKNQINQILSDEAKYQQEQRYIDAYKEHRNTEGAWIDEQRRKLETRDTDFDHQMDRNVEERKREGEQLEQAQKIRREAEDRGLGNKGGPGDVVGKANQIINDILEGKHVSQEDIDRVADVIKDRVSGKTAEQGEGYIPQDYLGGYIQLPSTMDEFMQGVAGSVRTGFTGVNPDGSTNWAAIGSRLAIGIGTAGTSEWVFTPVNMTYTAKDAIDRGAGDLEALRQTLERGAIDFLTGKAIQGGLGLAGKGFKFVFPGTAKSLSEAAAKLAEKIGKGFKSSPTPKVIPMRSQLDQVNRMLKSALKTGDEKALLSLYDKGGMKVLGKLEQMGHITPATAKLLNNTLTKAVNEAIDQGTERSINSFQKSTGVGVKRVYIGDSGSSAKGGPRSVTTDFDRTGVPEFEPQSLREYAAKNGMTPAQAERQLTKEFADTHFNEVDKSLKQNGMPGGADDVDYKTYNGIGSNAGNNDAYSYGFTTQRQSLGGKTKVYVPDGKGGVKSYQTSGEALVDADGLAKGRMDGNLGDNPNRIMPKELPGVISQQVNSAGKHTDVKSLAKGFGRTDAAAGPLNIQDAGLDKLRQVSKELNKNPQEVNRILHENGMTPGQYVEETRQVINDVYDQASKIVF